MSILKLNYSERLIISQFLPQKSDILEQTIVKEILDKTRLSPDVINPLIERVDSGGFIIRKEFEVETEIEFHSSEITLLKSEVAKAQKDRRIDQLNLSLAKKINEMN